MTLGEEEKEKKRKYDAEHYKKNKKRKAAYYQKNREKIRKRVAKRYQEDKKNRNGWFDKLWDGEKVKRQRDEYRARSKAKAKEKMSKPLEEIKRCGNCGRFLGVNAFHWDNRNIGQRRSYCKKCGWGASVIWEKDNIDKRATYSAKRRAFKLYQTSEDADQDLIRRIYLECSILNKSTGYTKWHVDHIFPLSKGGLHHQNNLQLLLAKDNLSKGAKINQTIKGE